MSDKTNNQRIPVCVISGFLGSGKTTLLNHMLNGDHGLNITVLVNDFGAINIDKQLLEKQDASSISLSNGCICCSMQSDLVDELLAQLYRPDGPPEYIVIESSGVSDPLKIINTLHYPQLRECFQIDTVLTLLDVQSINGLQGQPKQLAMAQLDAADIIVINKTDCVSSEQLSAIRKDWLYPSARIIETSYARVPMELIFGKFLANQFSAEQKVGDLKVVRSHNKSDENKSIFSINSSSKQFTIDHSQVFQSWSWRSDEAVCLDKLRAAINQLSEQVYRAKGIFFEKTTAQQRVILQLVGNRQQWSRDNCNQEKTVNQLVIIGAANSLDKQQLQAVFDACIA